MLFFRSSGLAFSHTDEKPDLENFEQLLFRKLTKLYGHLSSLRATGAFVEITLYSQQRLHEELNRALFGRNFENWTLRLS